MKPYRFSFGVALTFLTQLLNLAVSLATSVIINRVLGPTLKGIYVMATYLPALINNLGSLSLGASSSYFSARRKYPRSLIAGNTLLQAFLLGVFWMAAAALIVYLAGEKLFPGVDKTYLYFTLPLVVLGFINSYLAAFLLGNNEIKRYNFLGLAASIINLAAVAAAALFFGSDIRNLLIAVIFASLASSFLFVISALRIAGKFELRPHRGYFKDSLSYGTRVHLANVFSYLNLRVDTFLINLMIGTTGVGLYSVAVSLSEKLWMISGAVSTVIFPKVASEGESAKSAEFTALTARITGAVTFISSLLMFLLARPIIVLLFSERFAPSATALQWLLPGIVTLSVSRVYAAYISGVGKPQLNAYRVGFSALINIVLNLILIPRMGINGAALASTISYTFSLITAVLLFKKLSGITLVDSLVIKPADINAVRELMKSFKKQT